MKKISVHYLTVCLCFISYFLTGQNNRNIIFMHGLGGSSEAWVRYDEYLTSTRKANAFRFTYNEENGIPGAVASAKGQMTAAVPTSSYGQNIVIAHSQGGIVTRGIAKTFPANERPFGGFITVGTPNLGAKVITSYKTGKFTAFTQDATAQLLAGPNVSLLNLLPSWIPGVINSQLPGFIEQAIVNESGIDHSTTNDFYPGAPYLADLNNYNITIPKVGIVSSETTPNSHWKTLTSYALNSVTALPLNTEDDDDLEIYMTQANGFYTSVMQYYRLRATLAILPNRQEAFLNKAAAWEKGVKWFTNSESKYSELIGNLETKLVTGTTAACAPPCSTLDCTMNYSDCSWNMASSYSYYQTIIHPTDGIVPLANQYLPGAIENFVLAGPNHAEQRNHPEISKMFNKILDGTTGSANSQINFFIIPKS
jgi:pimeloyl-ACP methyl ester carboxylesterase